MAPLMWLMLKFTSLLGYRSTFLKKWWHLVIRATQKVLANSLSSIAWCCIHFLCGSTGVNVPQVLLVLGGGPNTIKMAVESIQQGTPVVFVQGSGRAADFIVKAIKMTTECVFVHSHKYYGLQLFAFLDFSVEMMTKLYIHLSSISLWWMRLKLFWRKNLHKRSSKSVWQGSRNFHVTST